MEHSKTLQFSGAWLWHLGSQSSNPQITWFLQGAVHTQNSACPASEGAEEQLCSPTAAPSSLPSSPPHPSRSIQQGQSLAVFLKSSPEQSLCYCTLLSLYFITYLFSFLQFASRGIDPWCSTDRRVCEMSKLHPLVDRQKSMEQRLLSST